MWSLCHTAPGIEFGHGYSRLDVGDDGRAHARKKCREYLKVLPALFPSMGAAVLWEFPEVLEVLTPTLVHFSELEFRPSESHS